MNAVSYKEIFPLIRDNRIWLGVSSRGMDFEVPSEGNEKKHVNVNAVWYTNLDHSKRHEELILYKKYSPDKYPKYDNYDAIEVANTDSIPIDYDGSMGVPITFLDKHNPDQFEIVCSDTDATGDRFYVKGKRKYARVVIRRRK